MRDETTFEAVDQNREPDFGRIRDEQLNVVVLTIERDKFGLEVGSGAREAFVYPIEVSCSKGVAAIFRDEDQMDVQRKDANAIIRT